MARSAPGAVSRGTSPTIPAAPPRRGSGTVHDEPAAGVGDARDGPGLRPHSAPWVLAGSALYLIGAIVVTIAANVPLNDALATVHPDGAGAAAHWSSYLSHWAAWNHVRAAAALAAAGLLTIALRLG